MKIWHNFSAGLTAITLLAVAACGGMDDKDEPDHLGAKDLCGGILSKDAEKALEQVTNHKKFKPIADDNRLDEVAHDIVAEFAFSAADSGLPQEHGFCDIYPQDIKSVLPEVEISFELSDGKFIGSPNKAPDWRMYSMGLESMASDRRAVIYFKCSSPKMDVPNQKSPIIRSYLYKHSEPKNEDRKYHDTNMTILHSAAVVMAKALDCKGQGGLPSKPDLKSVPQNS